MNSKKRTIKKHLKVEWVDKGKPVDLTIKKGEIKTATYILKVKTHNNRPIRIDSACISRRRKKGLINYGKAEVETKRNGIAYITFNYRTNKVSALEEEVQAKVRVKAEGHLAGFSDYQSYKEIILSFDD